MEEKLISQKKPFYPIVSELATFLKSYDRWIEIPIHYNDLLRFSGSVIVYDKNDNDTLWVSVYFSDTERREIDFHLKKIYTLLHSDGNESGIQYLNVDSIDYCTFGNSKPFRIKIRNILNDNLLFFFWFYSKVLFFLNQKFLFFQINISHIQYLVLAYLNISLLFVDSTVVRCKGKYIFRQLSLKRFGFVQVNFNWFINFFVTIFEFF